MKKILFPNSLQNIIRLLLVCCFISFSLSANTQTLDQSQLIYTGGMSARTLNGYSEWQSFTAGLSGTLSEIKMGFFNYINGVGTLKIFKGTGTAGSLLQSKLVNVQCASGNCLISFPVAVPSVAGQVYTFQFIPGPGMPDPYGVQVQMAGTYPGGYMGLVDPSGTTPLAFDMVFQTYVNTTFPIKLLEFSGENKANINQLRWSTATETNNQFFQVEKSENGREFKPIGSVRGAGNSNQINHYKFADYSIQNGMNYYRLKQVDNNGLNTYSPMISIKSNVALSPYVYISTMSKTTYLLSLQEPQFGYVCLYNLNGVLLKKISINISDSNIKIDLSNNEMGMYFLQIKSNIIEKTFRIFRYD